MGTITRSARRLALSLWVAGQLAACTQDITGPGRPAAASVTLSPEVGSVALGATLQITATVRDDAGNALSDRPVQWASSDPAVASVSETGLVTGVAPGGPVAIAATCEGVRDTALITVVASSVPVATVSISPDAGSLVPGGTLQLEATTRDQAGSLLTGRVVSWSSSDAAVATVSQAGLVTAVAVGGPVVITASSEGKAGTAQITVSPPRVASVTVAPDSAAVSVGGTLQLAATPRDSTGAPIAGRTAVWTSGDPSIVSVSAAGLVTGVASGGPITISASVDGVIGTAQVRVTAPFAALTTGRFHSCALLDGSAHCWGAGAYGMIGNGSTADRLAPVAVAGGRTYTALEAGNFFTCGLTASGAAYCWGSNFDGQLGDGTFTDRLTPVAVGGGLSFMGLTAGGSYGSIFGRQFDRGHVCGLTAGGSAYCWGNNFFGQLGLGNTLTRTSPIAVPGFTFASISAGQNFTCGLTTAGLALCWGSNAFGQLGDGTTVNRFAPVPVLGGLQFVRLRAGSNHACGLTAAGSAYCWGRNADGELGDGSTTQRLTPTPVSGAGSFAAIEPGVSYTCARTATGATSCWGDNVVGQLGDGTSTDRSLPTAVSGGLLFASLATGGNAHTCALAVDGAAYCWGGNGNGQRGDGTTATALVPTRVLNP